MRTFVRILTLVLFLSPILALGQNTGKNNHTLEIIVTDKDTKEPVIMATVTLQPMGTVSITNADGYASLRNVEKGSYDIVVSYVGYQSKTIPVSVDKSQRISCQLVPSTLALKEVSVTARQNVSGASTSSVISRQAIDHLQATSLADIMQLVPGQLMGNVDLTSTTNTQLQIRSASQNTYDSNSAFGSVILVDGVPISNNGNVAAGNFSNTAPAGTDMRNISADDIEEVEVIRGIPSAEYGDLTSGMVVVHSKIGVTPWQVKGKVNPALMNYSLGKGLRIPSSRNTGKGGGVLNFNLDYAQAWGDPREKSKSFDRYTFSAGYGYDISRKWHTDTKIRYNYSKTWSGNDPDAIQDGTEDKSTNKVFSLTHNGKIRLDKFFSRNISYTVGVSLTQADSKTTTPKGGGLTPIFTARTTGYNYLVWQNTSYIATGYTESRPGNFYMKANNTFYIRSAKTNQTFKMGIDYKYDWNSGAGFYNADDTRPLKATDGGRPRAFTDIPGLHQFAAYLEDNFSWHYSTQRYLRIQLGGRFTAMQPFSDVKTFSFSPRLNAHIDLTDWRQQGQP